MGTIGVVGDGLRVMEMSEPHPGPSGLRPVACRLEAREEGAGGRDHEGSWHCKLI